MSREPLMNASEVAAYLGISKDKAYELGKRGLPVLRVGRRWRCRPEDLDRWLRGESFDGARAAPGVDELVHELSVAVAEEVEPLPGGSKAIDRLKKRWATILAAREDDDVGV